MKNNKQQLNFLKLFAVCVSLIGCPKGPLVDICIVDSKQYTFDCANMKDKWKMSFPEGSKLMCSSPFDTQQFLLNCHKGKIIEIPVCQYSIEKERFECKDIDGMEFIVSILEADNYTCLSESHKQRIINRCIK